MTPCEKQVIWRKKQIQIFYGSGRPLFNINEDNQFERKTYDCVLNRKYTRHCRQGST